MEVKFRIDAKSFRKDIQNILNRKVKGITSDTDLYDTISRILVSYIREYLPVDTGALRDQTAGESEKSGYFREGYLEISKSHGIVWDALEQRPREFRHYAKYVMGKVLGIYGQITGADVQAVMMQNGDWDAFIQECTPYIIEAFKEK